MVFDFEKFDIRAMMDTPN
ncbi:unnamed protein product [Lathyrus sativus]|nr:unnamed protein product [Lathyrus sativus]CAK8065632.1 unnamed protein product [Lathyrus sativus]